MVMCKENMSSKGNGKDKITEAGTSIVCPRDVTDTIVVGAESSNRTEQGMLGARASFCNNPDEQ